MASYMPTSQLAASVETISTLCNGGRRSPRNKPFSSLAIALQVPTPPLGADLREGASKVYGALCKQLHHVVEKGCPPSRALPRRYAAQ